MYISRDLYEQLVRVAPSIYGKKRFRGAISYVVEEALRHYLLPRLHTQIHTNPKHSVRLIYEQVVEEVKSILNLPFKPKEVPEKILDLAIAETRGSDPRTIQKWKEVFKQQGLIKFAGGFPPNRIVELL